jgi:hypothetical protein
MPPPFIITGSAGVDWTILVAGVLLCVYWLRVLRLARQGARLFLRNLALSALVFCTCELVLPKLSSKDPLPLSLLLAIIVCFRKGSMRRSRHIPASEKRAVIARHRKKGNYDPKTHHIDHIQPFSKFGSHTADNLRVVPKEKNLKKGARLPRPWELW